MKKIGYTYKKRTSAYQKRDETKQKWFQTNVNKKLVYIYESEIDNSSKDGYDYSKKGKRCILKRKAGQRITIVGSQKECKSQAMILFKGNMNKEISMGKKIFYKNTCRIWCYSIG